MKTNNKFIFQHLDCDGDIIWEGWFPSKEAALKEAKKTLHVTLKNEQVVDALMNRGIVEIYDGDDDGGETLVLSEVKLKKKK